MRPTTCPCLYETVLLVVSVILLISMAETACPYGPGLIACGRNLSTLGPCIDSALDYDIPFLAKGFKDLKVLPIDPLDIPLISLKSANGRTATLTSCQLTGGSRPKVKDYATDFQTMITYSLTIPKFSLSCAYTMTTGFLSAAKANSGKFTLHIENYKSSFRLSTSFVTACNKGFVDWTGGSSKFVSSSKPFVASFSGLTVQPNAVQLKTALIAAFEPLQAKISWEYLRSLYQFFPPVNDWFPSNTSPKVSFCLQKKRC